MVEAREVGRSASAATPRRGAAALLGTYALLLGADAVISFLGTTPTSPPELAVAVGGAALFLVAAGGVAEDRGWGRMLGFGLSAVALFFLAPVVVGLALGAAPEEAYDAWSLFYLVTSGVVLLSVVALLVRPSR